LVGFFETLRDAAEVAAGVPPHQDAYGRACTTIVSSAAQMAAQTHQEATLAVGFEFRMTRPEAPGGM
jgi:hypothetical protein